MNFLRRGNKMMVCPVTGLVFLIAENYLYPHLFCRPCICAVAAFVSREKCCFDGLREGISSELHKRGTHPPPLSNIQPSPALSLSLPRSVCWCQHIAHYVSGTTVVNKRVNKREGGVSMWAFENDPTLKLSHDWILCVIYGFHVRHCSGHISHSVIRITWGRFMTRHHYTWTPGNWVAL